MTDAIFTRNAAGAGFRPQTFDAAGRSVAVTAVTESPVRVWDPGRGDFVDEILILEGARLPPEGRVPLLDSHNRATVSGVLGSAGGFARKGDTLECRVRFSDTEAGRDAAINVRDGHLTDFSVGYMPTEAIYLADGETRVIGGAVRSGPAKVTLCWHLKELSVTAIGADQRATARSYLPLSDLPEEGKAPWPPADLPLAETLPADTRPLADWEAPDETVMAALWGGAEAPTAAEGMSEPLAAGENTPLARSMEVPLDAVGNRTSEFGIATGNRTTEFGIATGDRTAEFGIATGDHATEFGIVGIARVRKWIGFGIVDVLFYAVAVFMIVFFLKGLF